MTASRGSTHNRNVNHGFTSGVVSQAFALSASLAALVIITRALTPAQYGTYATLTSLTSLLAVADLGLGASLTTRMAPLRVARDISAQRQLVSGILGTLTSVAALVLIVGISLAALAQRYQWIPTLGSQAPLAVMSLCIGISLSIPATLAYRLLLAVEKGVQANILLASGPVVSLATTYLLIELGTPLWLLVLNSTATPAVVMLAVLTRLLYGPHSDLRPRTLLASWAAVRVPIRMGSAFLLMNLSLVLAYQLDLVIVASTLGPEQAAQYAIALRAFLLISQALGVAIAPLWPAFAHRLAEGDMKWIKRRLLVSLAQIFALATLGSTILIVLGPTLIQKAMGPGYVPGRLLLILMGTWTVLSLCWSACSYLLNAAAVLWAQVSVLVANAIANVIVTLYLTKSIGITGPVVSSITCFAAIVVLPTLIMTLRVLKQHSGERENV